MSDRPLPPPLPPPTLVPFAAKAKDETTAPGIGMPPEMVAVRRENARLRRERDEALALVEENERSSVPPLTRKQRAVGTGLRVGKWGALFTLLPAIGAAVAQLWPDYKDTVGLAVELVRSVFGS